MRPYRFGYQLDAATAEEVAAKARAVEAAGFDVLHTWDHVRGGDEGWSPLAPLMAAAAVTSQLRLCPLVLNNDFHHPVHLAREIASMDRLTGGRVELGLGAGHAFPEYTAIGLPFDPPRVRKERLAEAVEILHRLLAGDEVTHHGEHYRLDGVSTMAALQKRLLILVGVNGQRALTHAARHADIIGLTMLGRTLEDGHRHAVDWAPRRIDAAVDHIRRSAGERWDELELNALVQAVVVTDNPRREAAHLAERVPGLTIEDALAAPFLAFGTHEEIAAHLEACRDRWGISYFSVRTIDAFAPVIEMLRAAA